MMCQLALCLLNSPSLKCLSQFGVKIPCHKWNLRNGVEQASYRCFIWTSISVGGMKKWMLFEVGTGIIWPFDDFYCETLSVLYLLVNKIAGRLTHNSSCRLCKAAHWWKTFVIRFAVFFTRTKSAVEAKIESLFTAYDFVVVRCLWNSGFKGESPTGGDQFEPRCGWRLRTKPAHIPVSH